MAATGEQSDLPKDAQVRQADLPALLWIGLPALSLAVVWLTPLMGFERWQALMAGEIGFIEIATVAFLVPAFVLAGVVFFRRKRLPRGVGVLMLLGGLAALYFAGEEISWGQSWIGFKTPQAIAERNDQEEFNLHNLHGLNVFNNVPRQLMLCMTLVGGCILPLALRKRLSRPEARAGLWYWIIPTWRLVPVAVMAVLSTVPEKVYKSLMRSGVKLEHKGYLNLAFIEPAGEFKEYCFALVILLYIASVYARMRAHATLKAGEQLA